MPHVGAAGTVCERVRDVGRALAIIKRFGICIGEAVRQPVRHASVECHLQGIVVGVVSPLRVVD